MLDRLLNVIAPFDCINCAQEGALVCNSCLPKILVAKRSSCFLCNRLTQDWRACTSCRHKTSLRGVVVASHYEAKIKLLIRQLKYQHRLAAAQPLAKLLASFLPPSFKFDVITWAPAATSRLHQRGYNPAQTIAVALAKQLHVPYLELLGKLGQKRQVGTSRRKRLAQVSGTVYVLKPARIKDTSILIVDDVVTTGATINECARALKAAGAQAVWAAAVAKH